MKAKWQHEKQSISKSSDLHVKLEQARFAMEKAEREDLNGAAQLKYGTIPDLEKEIEEAQKAIQEDPDQKRLLNEEVTDEDIAQVVASWTGVAGQPDAGIRTRQTGAHGIQVPRQRVVGQAAAVSAVSNALCGAHTGGLQDPKAGGILCLFGPHWRREDEMAKALAEFLFDDEQAMVRIDMTEYMEKHAVARLIGPPGYVGFEDSGQLTESVRRRPYSVLLFDEIEKAHPDVFHILLQVLDDGRLTDGQGREVDFRNTVIISPAIWDLRSFKSILLS